VESYILLSERLERGGARGLQQPRLDFNIRDGRNDEKEG